MKNLTVFLVLPFLIRANIDIDIIASEDESECQVHISGSIIETIPDKERDTFQLYDGKLKDAINTYIGMRPNDVFLKSPTPWNDLYKTFGWQQVSRILTPIKAKMLTSKYEPKLILRQHFHNSNSQPTTFKAYIRQDVEDTYASIWTTSGELTTGLNISYGFDIQAMAVSGKATMTYTSRWGENVMKSQTVTVGSKVGLEITLLPNQTAIASLYATSGRMQVQVDYEATLTGSLAVNFDNGYKDHHFWGLDVNKVMKAGGLNTSVFSSEVITLNYYVDSVVDVRDEETMDLLY